MKLILAVATLALFLFAKPASAESRAEATEFLSAQVRVMMALCGEERTDHTKRDIANRFDDPTFDFDHAKVLVRAAIATSSSLDDSELQQACKKWHDVFVYTGALKK
jgi:hypothetical protein